MKPIGIKEQIQRAHTREEALAVMNSLRWHDYTPRYHRRCIRAFIGKWGPL